MVDLQSVIEEEGNGTPDEISVQALRRKYNPPAETSCREGHDSYYINTSCRNVDRPRRPSNPIARTLYDSSSADDYGDDGYRIGANEESFLHLQIVQFHSRPVGPPHIGLRSIKPAKKLFYKLLSYRSYKLKNTTDTRSALETTKVRLHLNNLTLTMKNHTFDGNDPIDIFDFLIHFVNEADMLKMSEALPTFLVDLADTHFRTNFSGASHRGGVTCWPEAVKYLVRTYGTPSAMREDLYDIRTIEQQDNELKESYRKRFNNAFHRCCNEHCEEEKITIYMEGVSETTRIIVARHLESVPRRDLTFEDITHFARSEDEAFHARARQDASTRSYYNLLPRSLSPIPRTAGSSSSRPLHMPSASPAILRELARRSI